MIKRYQVTKVIFANSPQEIIDMEKGGEIVMISLQDDVNVIKEPIDIGFKVNNNGER